MLGKSCRKGYKNGSRLVPKKKKRTRRERPGREKVGTTPIAGGRRQTGGISGS